MLYIINISQIFNKNLIVIMIRNFFSCTNYIFSLLDLSVQLIMKNEIHVYVTQKLIDCYKRF